MRKHRYNPNRGTVFVAVALFCLVGHFGCGTHEEEPGYIPDPELYSADSDPEMLRELPDFPGTEVFADEVLVVPVDRTRATADRLATDVGGEVVGQVPSIGLFQIKLDSTTIDELEPIIQTLEANSDVDAAMPNVLGTLEACPSVRDVSSLEYPMTCPWEDTGYFAMTTILEELGVAEDLREVKVAVVDSGLQIDNGEFDDATVFNASEAYGLNHDLLDFVGHGTSVAGVIAADNDGHGLDGIASIMGNRLNLVVSRMKMYRSLRTGRVGPSGLTMYEATQRALDAGATVVNISAGLRPGDRIAAYQDTFDALFHANPGVFFVFAAGNENFQLTEFNAVPAGLRRDNTVTVSSTAPCDPSTRIVTHTWGEGVDMAAQGRDLALVGVDGNVVVNGGTSFTAPQVAAAATLLRSIEPGLTPSQIKNYLFSTSRPAPAEVGGRFLNTARAVNKLVLETRNHDEILDADADGQPDAAGLVAARVCSGSEYSIEGVGTFRYGRDDPDDVVALGTIAEEGIFLNLIRPGSDALGLNCVDCAFELETFELRGSFNSPDIPDRMPQIGTIAGELTGQWTFLECVIEDRYEAYAPRGTTEGFPDPDLPQNIRITSEIAGGFTGIRVDGYDDDGNVITTEISSEFSGQLSTNFVGGIQSAESAIATTMETVCTNGRLND